MFNYVSTTNPLPVNIIKNLDTGAYDATHDAMKESHVWNGYKLLTSIDLTLPASGSCTTDWINDVDIAGAKKITLFFTTNQTVDVELKDDASNPALIGYFRVTGGSLGSIAAGSWTNTFDCNCSNFKFTFYNKTAVAGTITNIKIRLQY